MKTIISFWIVLVIFNLTFSQNKAIRQIDNDPFSLTKLPQISEEEQINQLIGTLLFYYKDSFKYYRYLLQGSYSLEKTTQGYTLNIVAGKKILDKIRIVRIYRYQSKDFYFIFDPQQFPVYVDLAKLKYSNAIRSNEDVNIVKRNDILLDREIMNSPQYSLGKILNRTIALNHTRNQYGERSVLFYDIEDGAVLPYNGGQNAKIVTVDGIWDASIWFSRDNFMKGTQSFGTLGTNDLEFFEPTSCTFGYGYDHGSYWEYLVYFVDRCNKRVSSITFYASDNSPSGFDYETYSNFITNMDYPYDMSYFLSASEEDDPASDKIWISESHRMRPAISCYNCAGYLVQNVVGYKLKSTGDVFLFEEGTESRISTYWQGFGALAFIDNVRNSLVTCALYLNGMANVVEYDSSYVIVADNIRTFPDSIHINSVNFHQTSNGNIYYPYLWVTSGYSLPTDDQASMIHGFKLNSAMQLIYLGSADLPSNTDNAFHNLTNIINTDGYFDIFTVEKWTNYFGIRKYFPNVGIFEDTLKNYCRDSLNQMKWKAFFLNDCYIKLAAETKVNETEWQTVPFVKIDDEEFSPPTNNPLIYRWAGNNTVTIQLKLPLKDIALGGTVRVHAYLYPEFAPEDANYQIVRNYEVPIEKLCMPKPGGCPFVYVLDSTSTYSVDNNILHRSEFSEFAGQDILDRYKLNIKPLIDSSTGSGLVGIAIVENEADSSQFDQIKFHAIDHAAGWVLGVTESNDYVLYNPSNVISTDDATLNSQDITNLIQYTGTTYIKVIIGDTISAHYPQPQGLQLGDRNPKKPETVNTDRRQPKIYSGDRRMVFGTEVDIDSVALIILTGNLDTLNPVTQKNWAGSVNALSFGGSPTITKYARRERLSEVVVPLFAAYDYLDQATIYLSSDAKIRYIATVPINYPSSLIISELSLTSALVITRTSQTDVSAEISRMDQWYAKMDSSGFIQVQFSTDALPELPDDYVRDYIIEVNGKYFPVNSMHPMNVINNVPLSNRLYHNYPNPFNPKTRIRYEINKNISVKVTIYNILGQEVKVLVNEFKNAGRYEVDFDGTNYASGVYFYRIEAGDFIDAKKMVLVK